MAFYETVFIIRQDVASTDVDRMIEDFSSLIEKMDSKVIKTEYWGLRSLAYDINNNKKGHYVMIASNSTADAIKEVERKMKLSEDVIRFLTNRVEAISSEPSPVLKSRAENLEDTIDVTIA